MISLGDISKPATVLIEKIAEATGGIFKPWQIRRVAEAHALAEKIDANAQIEIVEMQQRALQRFVLEECKKQENIEKITQGALPLLTDGAKPESIENDWITNFFEKSRSISDQEMQNIWSAILAGEANVPGSFSKRTVNFVASLDKNEANIFTILCGFNWKIGTYQPLIYDTSASIYTKQGINFGSLMHLDAIGLITFLPVGGYKKQGFEKKVFLTYQSLPILVEFNNTKDNELQTGLVILTNVGQELAKICTPPTVDGFAEYVLAEWMKHGIKASSPWPKKL